MSLEKKIKNIFHPGFVLSIIIIIFIVKPWKPAFLRGLDLNVAGTLNDKYENIFDGGKISVHSWG